MQPSCTVMYSRSWRAAGTLRNGAFRVSPAGSNRRQQILDLCLHHRWSYAMAQVKHVHRVLGIRENFLVASMPSAKDQLAQLILEQSVFARPRAPFRETRERVDFHLDRIEPPFGGIGRLGRDPARGLVDVPNRPRLDDDAIVHFASSIPCFSRSRAKSACAGKLA